MVVARVERADVHGRRDERPGTGTDGDGSTASANPRVSLAARDSRRRSLRPGVGQGDRGSRRYRVRLGFANVRFSNRPVWVKRFQAIHHFSVDVACGLVLLFGLGAKALPVWDSRNEVEQSIG